MPFHEKALNAFEMTHRESACEIPPANPGHLDVLGEVVPQPEPARKIRR